MKKFRELIISAMVEIKINDVLIIIMIRIHLIKNLAIGGIPAKLAIIINISHFFTFLLDSVFSMFILKFFNKYITIMTDVQ